MSLRQLADLAYHLQVEQLRRTVATERLVAAVAVAAGGRLDGDPPDEFSAVQAFDAALVAAPEAEVDPARWELMVALGLR